MIPSGMSNVPFEWNSYMTKYPMLFCAGFIGIVCTPGGSITPGVTWAIGEIQQLVDPSLLKIYQKGSLHYAEKYGYEQCQSCKTRISPRPLMVTLVFFVP